MRSVRRLLSLLMVMALIISFAAPLRSVFAEENKIRVYTSAKGAPSGSYYMELSEYADTINHRIYQHAYLIDDMSYDDAVAYANEQTPKIMAQFLAAEWYIDPESYLFSANLPAELTNGDFFSFYDDSTYLYEMLHLVDDDSLSWISVAVPEKEDDVFDHGQWYVNLNYAYEYFYNEAYTFYINHPEYTEDWDYERLNEECHEYAMYYIDIMRAAEFYVRPDDPLFTVKMCSTDDDGYPVTDYFPKEAVMIPDLSEFVMEFHDYYWVDSWNWIDPDTATVTVLCYIGEVDGTNDVLVDEVTDITKVTVREASELQDGIIECTGRYYCQGVWFTDTHTFYTPPTGNPERVTITRQPEDVTVNYPEGAEFSVEVDREDFVKSYQWILGDGVKEYVLDGITANSDTLVCPSTGMFQEYVYYYCIVTDLNGNVTISDKAGLYVSNYSERKVVLYVGDYALEPGDTLDLEETPLGSGIVTFDADGKHMTFDNVSVTASRRSMDGALGSGSMGLFLQGETFYDSEYHMNFKGKCVFTDDYYDAEIDAGGVVINADLASSASEDRGALYIEGDGDLNLIGGSDSIYSDGYVEICSSYRSVPYDDHPNRGINVYGLVIDKGVHADITCRGIGILASTTVYVRDEAVVDIDATAPRIYDLDTDGKAIYCMDLYCGEAKIDINTHAHPEDFVPYGHSLVTMSAIKCNASVDFAGTKVNIRMDADESDHVYAYDFTGITGEPLYGISMTKGAELNIDIASRNIYTCKAIFAQGSGVYPDYKTGVISLEDGSSLSISAYTSGHATGIEVSRPVSVEDSTLKVDVKSYDTAIVIGVDAPELDVDLTDSKYSVDVNAENGSALIICDTDQVTDTEFTEDYEPKLIKINEEAKILVPEDGVISCYGFDPWRSITPVETILSKADTEYAASRVLIAVPKDPAPPTGDNVYIWALVMGACITAAAVMIKKYRETVKIYGK
ncbi:MAG: hypothetical protein J5528_02160 [Firmicutes bacterium]|nr:hypothetical protein [Bacillota bacterium]